MTSLMAEWLEQATQWYDMYYHDLEFMSSNPGQVKRGVHRTSALSRTWTKHYSFGLSHTYKEGVGTDP